MHCSFSAYRPEYHMKISPRPFRGACVNESGPTPERGRPRDIRSPPKMAVGTRLVGAPVGHPARDGRSRRPPAPREGCGLARRAGSSRRDCPTGRGSGRYDPFEPESERRTRRWRQRRRVMDPKVIAALIAASAALLVSVANVVALALLARRRTVADRGIEILKGRLDSYAESRALLHL